LRCPLANRHPPRRIVLSSEVSGVMARILQAHPEARRGHIIRVRLFRDDLGSDLRPALLILLGGVGLVLLVACGNVASLMLVRATARTRELVIRAALGAGRQRLVASFLPKEPYSLRN
jgi:putative ABC transport system permease protein